MRFVIIFIFHCQLFYIMFVCHMFGFDVFYWVYRGDVVNIR